MELDQWLMFTTFVGNDTGDKKATGWIGGRRSVHTLIDLPHPIIDELICGPSARFKMVDIVLLQQCKAIFQKAIKEK
jgi:hypothetical protein